MRTVEDRARYDRSGLGYPGGVTEEECALVRAQMAGCATVWSEDMQDGMVVGEGLRVENPF